MLRTVTHDAAQERSPSTPVGVHGAGDVDPRGPIDDLCTGGLESASDRDDRAIPDLDVGSVQLTHVRIDRQDRRIVHQDMIPLGQPARGAAHALAWIGSGSGKAGMISLLTVRIWAMSSSTVW